jgi:hypothetical protein
LKNDTDELLNDLLRRWHLRELHAKADTGYYTENTTCKLYRTSRQHDDSNGALDSDQDSSRLEAVGHCIDMMDQPWKTAVEFNARDLALGASGRRSPRLPVDDMERAHLLLHARAKLLILLERAGVA